MLPTKLVLLASCTLAAVGKAYSYPRQQRDREVDQRVRTATVTETESETVTETETITKTASCFTNDKISTTKASSLQISTTKAMTKPTTTASSTKNLNSEMSSTSKSSATTTGTTLPTASDGVSKVGNCFVVKGVGSFTTKKQYDFKSGTLSSELQVSDYNVPDQNVGNPWNHGFKPSNVLIADGFLKLVVPGRQRPSRDSAKAIYGGEIYTSEANILYGSIRTKAIFDDTPGTCQGIFSYHDDTNEIDIEYLGNSSSTANPSPNEPPVFWYTNQPGGSSDNQVTGPAPDDVTSKVYEYRIDWTRDWTKFYINGVLQNTLKVDVPQIGSQWVWNNWANGSPYWSTGPPIDDNVFKIQSITMYYNTADNPSCE